MLNFYEKLGRELCKIYYKPLGRHELPMEILEKMDNIIASRPCWVKLMSGTLREVSARVVYLGEIVEQNEGAGVDGREQVLRLQEVALYSRIGKLFKS